MGRRREYIVLHMKQILIELDDQSARDLERVAPTKKRMRAEFVRLAIRHALDIALDRTTEHAYRELPLDSGVSALDLRGWDDRNELAVPARKVTKASARKNPGGRSGGSRRAA